MGRMISKKTEKCLKEYAKVIYSDDGYDEEEGDAEESLNKYLEKLYSEDDADENGD